MSNFNEANDLANELIEGRTYQGDEPCFPIQKIVFYRDLTDEEDRITITNDGSGWATVASRIQSLLGQGYNYTALPCEYCGATEVDDVLHCDECGEPILHGYERAGVDEDGDEVTYCDGCQTDHSDAPLEEL